MSDTSRAKRCGWRWCQYRPLTAAAGSSLTASQVWVRYPISKSSGAPGPPIFVATQPGSTALLSTSGHHRATAKARAVTFSLLSEYAWLAFQRRSSQSMSRSEAPPPRCMPLLRYTKRRGRSISAVSMYGASVLTARMVECPSGVGDRPDVAYAPALWMTASIRPSACAYAVGGRDVTD